jgi:hypothetical protein
MTMLWASQFSGAVAGWTPEFIEMMQDDLCHKSGSAQLWGR